VLARLSLPIENMRDHYAVVVVGSGYGGSIAASRLARAGQDVCLLERGRELRPGEYPDTQHEVRHEMQFDAPHGHVGSRTALLDFRVNHDLNILVGCGLGGTSLINANVALRAEPRVFEDDRWPNALREDGDGLLEAGYLRAEEMLRPTPYPEDGPRLAKLAALERSAQSMRAPFYRPPLNVTFVDGPNHVGVEQAGCALCGDCVTGCNHGAKNTTLMNYLPDARQYGASIFTQVSVRWIERRGDRWAVHYQPLGSGREAFHAPTLFVTSDIVILSAGAVGSTEILLRSREHGLPLSDRVGARFTGNGDVLGFGYNASTPVDGVGFGSLPKDGRAPVGPCITGIIDLRECERLDDGMVIEDGSIPTAVSRLMPAFLATASKLLGRHAQESLAEHARADAREAESLVFGPYQGATRNTGIYLVMTHDDGEGRLRLERDRVRLDWPGVGAQPIFSEVDRRLTEAAQAIGSTYVRNPIWTKLAHQELVTVHPLGGCVMAESAESGVVDHRGRVFSSTVGDEVHSGLYVSDGAVIPRPLAVNPLLTISALAERSCALLAAERGWTIDYALGAPKSVSAVPAPVGIQFTERMHGWFARGSEQDFAEAARRGQREASSFEFTLTIISKDLERMLEDTEHAAAIVGTVQAPALSAEPLVVSAGEFNLFVVDEERIGARQMRYRLPLASEEGAAYFVDGFKRIHDDRHGFDLWADTTTLFITVHEGATPEGSVVGRGVLRIAPQDFVHQLGTMHATNAATRRERLAALARFGRFFAGTLFDTYGGIFARPNLLAPDAPPRKKRQLTAPAPDVYPVAAGDGATVQLTRYAGGTKGPVVLAHPLGASSAVFTIDTIDTNLVEFLCGHGYDVWLLDWRASIALPRLSTGMTLDDVARRDWPVALAAVREETAADFLDVVAHGSGALPLLASLGDGLDGIRSIVSIASGVEVVVPRASRVRSGLHLDALAGVLAASQREDGIADRHWDRLLRLYPVGHEERCQSPTCHRATFLYGLLYEHEQLNRATHDALHEFIGVIGRGYQHDLARIAQAGGVVDQRGFESEAFALPITFLHGERDRVFLPDSAVRSHERLAAQFGPELYARRLFPGYGHLDLVLGRDAAVEVYPAILEPLERAQATDVAGVA
jgi:cholesterol oxidase